METTCPFAYSSRVQKDKEGVRGILDLQDLWECQVFEEYQANQEKRVNVVQQDHQDQMALKVHNFHCPLTFFVICETIQEWDCLLIKIFAGLHVNII